MTTRQLGASRAMRTLVVTALLVVLVVLVLVAADVVRHGRTDAAAGSRPARADAILVLGAAQFDGRPQEFLVARLEHARRLYQSGAAPRILTLGGKQPGDRFTEGEAGRNWLIEHGVPQSAVVAVGEGNDTLQSIRGAADLMRRSGWSSALVVTDPWHELRSTTMLADEGLAAYGSPTPTGPSVEGLPVEARYVGRETVAYLAYEAGRLVS